MFLKDSPTRLSSSPASSPCVVRCPRVRIHSVHPSMSGLMDTGSSSGAEFSEDLSAEDDGSIWEDDDETHELSGLVGLGISAFHDEANRSGESEVQRLDELISGPDSGTAGTKDTGEGLVSSASEPRAMGEARKMSLRRMGKVRLVDTHGLGSAGEGTPRESMQSNDSENTSLMTELPFAEDSVASEPESNAFGRRHTRATSIPESLRADSIINAHILTLRALDLLAPNSSLSHFHDAQVRSRQALTNASPRHASYPGPRRVVPPPLQLDTTDDADQPPHLPSHFVKTPYPFMAQKIFPKPKTRPRQHHVPSIYQSGGFDNAKGKHVLDFVANDVHIDMRSRHERNDSAQGVVRVGDQNLNGKWDSTRSTDSSTVGKMVVWLSLQRRRGVLAHKLEHIVVPSSLTTVTPPPTTRHQAGRIARNASRHATVDFDDQILAERLRDAYARLAGPWPLRLLSARRLDRIQLGAVDVWSGASFFPLPPSSRSQPAAQDPKLLAVRDVLATYSEARNFLTESKLLDLFRRPHAGRARYTWVHWVRRVAASSSSRLEASTSIQSTATPYPSSTTAAAWSNGTKERVDAVNEGPQTTPSSHARSPHRHRRRSSSYSPPTPDTLTTIQFTHAFSPIRILAALVLALALSILAALLWVFEGQSAFVISGAGEEGSARAERVGAGMVVGALALAVQGAVIGMWAVGSWAWY